MSYQEKTEVVPDGIIGIKDKGYLIGMVYFPYNSDRLDEKDKIELAKLYKPYSTLLRTGEVQFSCLGNADHRGTSKYNLGLGIRRARSVMRFLDEMFRNSENYSAASGASLGEGLAAQPADDQKPTRQQMAKDRFVSIVTSRTPLQETEIPPSKVTFIEPQPRLRRIVGREFEEGSHKEESFLVPKTPVDKGLDEGVERLKEEAQRLVTGQEKNPYFLGGREAIHRRRFRLFPRHYRVNEIFVQATHKESNWITGKITSGLSVVGYAWGEPRPTVTVHVANFLERNLQQVRRLDKTILLPREKAQKIRDLLPPCVKN